MNMDIYNTYDIEKSYDWNYENAPLFSGQIPSRPDNGKKIKLFDIELNSPIGIPAGPLLNSKWIDLYAKLGFDILVYKTVRTVPFKSHPVPNCLYVDYSKQLGEEDVQSEIREAETPPNNIENFSITNSFGVPSASPEVWMADVEKANGALSDGQVMIVSVMGTSQENETIAENYAKCASMAKEAGAKIIEVNYSCPNIKSGQGSIYQDAELSSEISKAVKDAIKDIPLLVKIGYMAEKKALEEFFTANAPYIDGISAINTIPMKVLDQNGKPALKDENRIISGVCGSVIRDISQKFCRDIANVISEQKYDIVNCGVGGIVKPEDFTDRLNGGADIVMSATGAMWDPYLANKYHKLTA